ncbi:YvrJ family protein [Marinicrinis sediminis]|uniref:YvrJ family protein n=1 Tax=Marinicrinis sediminis TaxID=1652465 RepID=A0ABW5R5X0_9BACL
MFQMDEIDFVNAIGNFGFPIMITIYLLIRFEKRIDYLNNSLIDLAQVIKEMSNRNKE